MNFIIRVVIDGFSKTKFLMFFIGSFLSVNMAMSQQLAGDELKSMEKSNSSFKSFKGGVQGVKGPGLNLSPEKMQWWQDAKFGLFIHWGLYAIPGTGEWTMFNQKIPAETYARFANQFKPRYFNGDTWAGIAKSAGMKYMVIVTRHHDGFAMWNSPASYSHFNSMETTAHTDYVSQYTAACRKAGLAVGLYYSPMDWRFPGYFDPKGKPENAALMKQQAYGQVEELMKNYGKIDILWYDGGWLAHKGGDEAAAWFWEPLKLNTMVRQYQPDIVINPRSGMFGDFQVNEGPAPVTGPIIDIPWEKCLNLNGSTWGYSPVQKLMSFKSIVQMLVNVVDRGGNMLLNVGPDPDGVIPVTHIARLKAVGAWLTTNGASIYGTRPGPFQPVDSLYGSTHKGNVIYIHLLKLPADKAELQLPAIGQKIISCTILNGGKVSFKQDENSITLMPDRMKLGDAVTTFSLVLK
jgi:alpha-L-fucosidase